MQAVPVATWRKKDKRAYPSTRPCRGQANVTDPATIMDRTGSAWRSRATLPGAVGSHREAAGGLARRTEAFKILRDQRAQGTALTPDSPCSRVGLR